MKRVAVTGAGGQIAYSLLSQIAKGEMFGPGVEISLRLLELPEALGAVQGIAMELEDCAFPLLREIVIGSDPDVVFEDVDWAILVGAKPRGPGMERRDLLQQNGAHFVQQGKSLSRVAQDTCRVLIVGNPCNTNALIVKHSAPHLHVAAMTRLDQNRAQSMLAAHAKVSSAAVSRVAIWGNHSPTMVPDLRHAQVNGKHANKAVEVEWLANEFVGAVQQRGAKVIAARGKSSALSAAQAIVDTVHDIAHPTEWFSLAVDSTDNPYGIAPDLMFSFPCCSHEGEKWEIVKGLDETDPLFQQRLRLTERELLDERDLVRHLL